MEYFIADTHFGHKNIIKSCQRPFDDICDMDNAMISNWQARIADGDTVYIVGDMFWNKKSAEQILPQLPGKKILITGNHDAQWLKGGKFDSYFESIQPYFEVEKPRKITFCHYPMIEWRDGELFGSDKLGFHIYGHIHNNFYEDYLPVLKKPHALNAGVEINGYKPVTFEELEQNNLNFSLSKLTSQIDRARLLMRFYQKYQVDKAGQPYIYHPETVSKSVELESEKTVALLHDILEDTDVPVEMLEANFAPETVEAVKSMTKAPGEDYFVYLERLAHNEIAKRVKLADLSHNMDLSRLSEITEIDLKRVEKYKKAVEFLTNGGK